MVTENDGQFTAQDVPDWHMNSLRSIELRRLQAITKFDKCIVYDLEPKYPRSEDTPEYEPQTKQQTRLCDSKVRTLESADQAELHSLDNINAVKQILWPKSKRSVRADININDFGRVAVLSKI